MYYWKKIIFATLLYGLLSLSAQAAGVADCDHVLVKDTYLSFNSANVDWRFASLVDAKTYDEVSHDASANGVIYGVPVGAKYSDFQENISAKKQQLNESYTKEYVRSIMWTGLSHDVLSAYTACLQTVASEIPGLYLILKDITNSDVALYIRWNPGNFGPDKIGIEWDGADEKLNKILEINKSGEGIPFIVPRLEDKEQHLIARIRINGDYKGGADIVVPAVHPKKPPIFECSKLDETQSKCLRCDFDIKNLPPSLISPYNVACIDMPAASKISVSFNGSVGQSKYPGEACQFVAEFKLPDGSNQLFNVSGVTGEWSCGIPVVNGPTSFTAVPNPNLVETSVRLHACSGTAHYNNCTLSGKMSIFVAGQ